MDARVSTRAFVFRKLTHAAFVAAISAFSLSLGACDGRDEQRTPARAQPPSSDTLEAGGEVADSTVLDNGAVWITDASALALLGVMNARQVAAANVELEAWHSDTIRAFAALVAREHAELQHSADSLAAHIRLVPVMSALDQRIDSAFASRVDSLRGLRGAPLERAFTHQQVVAEQAIADYANQLTGAVRTPEVQALMESAANAARTRLTRAQSFAAALAMADSIKDAAAIDSAAKVAARHRSPPSR
jgi:hypothetical protein